MMPVYKNERLKGLRGIGELSDTERNEYMQSVYDLNPDKKDQLDNLKVSDWDRLYRDSQFKNTLAGYLEETNTTINDYTPEQRDRMYTDYVVNNAVDDQFGLYPEELNKIRNSGLSTNGLIELLESDYVPTAVLNGYYDEKNKKLHNDYQLEAGMEESKRYIKKHDDDPLQLLGYASYGTNWLFNTIGNILVEPLEAGNEASRQKAIDKNEAILNNIADKDLKNRLEKYSSTGYPKQIQDNVWEVYNNAQSSGEKGIEVLKTWYDNLVGEDSYTDEQGRHIYKNSDGDWIYTNIEGKEEYAPEAIQMSDIEIEQYKELSKEGKVNPDEEPWQDEDGNWYRKIRRFEDKGNGAYHIFKDRKQFDENHVSPDQMVQWITDYLTLEAFEGRSTALQKSSLDSQKHISDNQFKLVTDISQIYSRIIGGLVNTTYVPIREKNIKDEYGEEGLANVLAGLNPDGTPVERYDRTNPYYWSMVETSGSTATGTVNDYIKYGYSPYQSIYDPTESEWGVRRTISDAMPMVGYSIEQMALAAATDGLSRVASGAVRGIGRGIANTVANRSTNTIIRNAATANYKFANKLGKGIIESQRFTVPVISSLGIAQGYGSEAFKNVYEQGMDQINELKRADALEYVQSYLGTDEYKQAVENEFNRIYQGYNEAQRKEYKGITNEDGSWELVNPEVYARRQAELKVRNDLLQAYMNNPEIQKSHNGQSYADMERKLKEDAMMAYKTDYFIEAASQSVNFAMFKTFLMTPSQRMLYNNKPTKIGFEKGGRKAWADMSKKEKWILTGKGVGKTAFGGTLSNYNDEIRRDWSQAFGYHDFNDYMGYITNPDNYVDQEEFHRSFWDGIRYANKIAGETALKESSFRAGIVGGLGSIIGFGPNIGGMVSMMGSKNRRVTRQQLQDNLKAIQEGHPEKVKTGWNTDSKGNRLDVLEMVGNFVTNPLFQSYQNAGVRMRMTEELVNSYNKFIEEHESEITNITNLLETAVRAYNMSLNGRGYYLNEQDDGEGSAKNMPISLTGAVIDNDALTAFEIVRRLSEYGGDKTFMNSDYLRRAYNVMQETLNGDRISEALVEDFLNDTDNKKDTFGMSDEEKRIYAERVLRDRIKDMKKVADAYNKARTNLNQSPFYTENDSSALNQVLYMSVMQDRWNDRLSKLNEELGNGNNHSAYYYGNKENYEQIRAAQIETVNSLKQSIAQVTRDKLKAKDRQDKVIKGLHINMLTRQLEAEQKKLDQINADNVWNAGLDGEAKAPVLSTEEILNLNASERAYILDESNYNQFSTEQKEVIDYLKALMVDETGTNQTTLDKVNDAKTLAERIQLNQMSLDQALTFPNSFITLTANTKRAYKANLINAYIDKLIQDEYIKLNSAQTLQDKMRVIKDSQLSKALLNEVIDMVPESTYNAEKIVFDGVLRERQLEEHLSNLIDDYSATDEVKDALRSAVYHATKDSLSEQDAMGQLELMFSEVSENPDTVYNIVDTNGETTYSLSAADLATHLNNLLSGLEKLNHMRNSAVVYNWREEQKQIRIEEERMKEAARIEAERQKAEMEAKLARKKQNEENERRAKSVSEQNYADSRERIIEPKTKEEYLKAKSTAKDLSNKYLAEILNGKSLKPLKTAIKNEKVNVTGIIETIQKYRNTEKLYGYLWNKSNNRTIAAIEDYLHELGYDWSSIEGKALDEATSKDIIVNDVRHDNNVFKGISIAENSTPYIYKDGILISKPRTDMVIGTQEITDEAVAPHKEWKRVRIDYRKFETQLVEIPYKPYKKQRFQTRKRVTAKDRLLDKFESLHLDEASYENMILVSIANGQKFKWDDGGIGELLNKDEKNLYRTIIDEENGITVDKFITDNLLGDTRLTSIDNNLDIQGELKNALQNVLGKHYTISDVLGDIKKQIDDHISEQERLEEETKEREIKEVQDRAAQEYGYPDMDSMKEDMKVIADVLQKEAEEKYSDEEMAEELASILDVEERKSMEEEAAKHQKELENEIQEWKEGISDIYYNTEIEDNGTEEEISTEPEREESEGTEGTESESPEVLQGEESTDRGGLEGTQPLQAGSESPTVNGEPQVRPRGTTAVIEPTKLDSEKSVNEFVADEVKDNPEGMDVQTFKTSAFPIRIDERSTEKKDRLLGNAIRLFDLKWLDEEGIFGPLSDTSNARRNLWNFLNEHKIRLQDIIDFELGKIIAEHPNIPIRFMKQKGSNNIYNVIEFTDDIAAMHNEDFGGVIESGGKKWLMVGILGYTMKNNWSTADQAALSDAQSSNFRIIREAIDSAMTETKEEFFVHPTIYTKVLEQSNGFITNRESETSRPKPEEKAQQETKVEQHSIKELLSKKATNPHGLQFETLKFGIQKDDTFIVYNLEDGLFYPIKETDKNGSSYVLIPAANGNYVPMYIQPTYYKLLKSGRLKESIDNIFLRLSDPRLTSSVASARIVQRDLEKYIAFGNNEKGVRLAIHDNGSVQILVDGISIAETTLGNIDAKFLNTLKNQNLRINVDRGVFTDRSKFDMYSDAGALNVTSQMLGLRGSVYMVSPLNNEGKPTVTVRVKSGVLRDNERQLPVKDRNTRRVAGYAYYGNIEYHRLANTPDIWREKDGTEVTDQELLGKLKYAEFIGQHKGFPNFAFVNPKNKKLTQYYIYDETSKTGLRYDVTNDTFEIMSEQQYDRMIEAIKDAEQKKAAELARREKEGMRAEAVAWKDNPTSVSTEKKEEKPIEKPVPQQSIQQIPSKDTRSLQGSQNSGTFALDDILRGKAGSEAKTIVQQAILDYGNRKGIKKLTIAKMKEALIENKVVLEPKNIQDWVNNINNCK